MNQQPTQSHDPEPDPVQDRRDALLRRKRGERFSLMRNIRFRQAAGVSVFFHVLLVVWATWAPSQPRFRFYGSGTAVNLVGAHEIPGGSARGKSGDRPDARKEALRSADKAARKIAVKKKTVSKKKAKKKKVSKKKPPKKPSKKTPVPKKRTVRKKSAKKDTVALKRKRAKARERLARLKKIKERRERERRWRQQYAKRKKTEQQKRTASAPPPKDSPAGKKAVTNRPKSKVGYPGEGGGDGQGGGSRGAGGGGAARSDLDRYYGLLAERVRNHWTIPLNLEGVNTLRTIVIVDVGNDGTIQNLEIERSSGNSAYDKAALRAVKSSADPAFPPLPNTVKDKWIPIGFRFCGFNFCRS